ncbi:MAG: BspA family leucine-rich repeat surface protein [Clostridiales bacterium]|nr:BspA family leucine-rich repeat surface protein [Clostridiales bacterium]
MKTAENKRKYIYSCVALTIVLLLVLSAGAILAKYVVSSNVAKIDLTIEAGGFYLMNGPDFNEKLRTLAGSETDTEVVIGYYDDYSGVIDDWDDESAVNVDADEKGRIRMFKKDDTVYVLFKGKDGDKITLNEDSSDMFSCIGSGMEDELQLSSITGLNLLDTSRVTDMSAMFKQCGFINDLEGVSEWDTSNVEDMVEMFRSCSSLTSLDLSGWDVSSVHDMSYMFAYCSALTTIDFSEWEFQGNYSNLDMQYMFTNCSNLETIDFSDLQMNGNLVSMIEMFSNCGNLQTIKMWNGIVVPLLVNGAFYNCSALSEIDISSFYTISGEVPSVDISQMFSRCSNLKTVYAGGYWDEDNIEGTDVFDSCTSIKGGAGTPYDANHIDADYARIDTADTPGYFTDIAYKPEYLDYTLVSGNDFNKAINNLNEDVENIYFDSFKNHPEFVWESGTPVGTNVNAFSDSDGIAIYILTKADVAEELIKADADCYRMFADLYSLERIIGLRYLDTSDVANMADMFTECDALVELDLSSFDTSNVTNMSFMFSSCLSIEQLDLSSFDTSKVTRFGEMFASCNNLTTIFVGEGWKVGTLASGDANGYGMFDGCNLLVGGNGTKCDGKNNIDADYAHIDVSGNPGYFTAKTSSQSYRLTRPQPTVTPEPSPTPIPTEAPTAAPEQTLAPVVEPTSSPAAQPTEEPTLAPAASPTPKPAAETDPEPTPEPESQLTQAPAEGSNE